jgi:hypothetical protein
MKFSMDWMQSEMKEKRKLKFAKCEELHTPALPGIPHCQIITFMEPSALLAGRAKNPYARTQFLGWRGFGKRTAATVREDAPFSTLFFPPSNDHERFHSS